MKFYTSIGYSYNSYVEMFAYPAERGAGKYRLSVADIEYLVIPRRIYR